MHKCDAVFSLKGLQKPAGRQAFLCGNKMNVKEFELKQCIQFVYRPSTYFIYTFTLVFALAKTRLYYIHTCMHNELYIYASFVETGGTAMKHSLFIFG